ncbi:hypothetical protein D3C78_692860 [compost metagenome]
MQRRTNGKHLAAHPVVHVLAIELHGVAELFVVGGLLEVVAVQPEHQVVGDLETGRIVEVENLPRLVIGVLVFLVETVGGLHRHLGSVRRQPGEGEQRFVGVEVVAGVGQAVNAVLAGRHGDFDGGAEGQVRAHVPENDRRKRCVTHAFTGVLRQSEHRDFLLEPGLRDVAGQPAAKHAHRAEVIQARNDRRGLDLDVRHLAAERADIELRGFVVVVVEVERNHVVRKAVGRKRQHEKAVGAGADVVHASLGGQCRLQGADAGQANDRQGECRAGRDHGCTHYYCCRAVRHPYEGRNIEISCLCPARQGIGGHLGGLLRTVFEPCANFLRHNRLQK